MQDIYSPFQYGWMTFNLFMALRASAALISRLLRRGKYAENFNRLSETRQRNAVTYILEIAITTFVFSAQIYGGADIIFKGADYTTESRVNWILLTIQLISALYIWEFVYRLEFGTPLLAHHIVTIVLHQAGVASLFDTFDVVYLRIALLLGFCATTEQLSYLALFCYRLDIFPNWHSLLFKAAMAQTLILKTISIFVCFALFVRDLTIGGLDEHTKFWKGFWTFGFPPLLTILYISQLYAVRIMRSLAIKCRVGVTSTDDGSSTTVENEQQQQSDSIQKTQLGLSSSHESNGGRLGTLFIFSDDQQAKELQPPQQLDSDDEEIPAPLTPPADRQESEVPDVVSAEC